MRLTLRLLAGLVALGGLAGLACCAYALAALRAWEFDPLWRLLGLRGIVFSLALVAGLALLTTLCARTALGSRPLGAAARAGSAAAMVVWLACIAWLSDWLFREQPFSLPSIAGDSAPLSDDGDRAAALDFESFSLGRSSPNEASRKKLWLMYERVRLNQPALHRLNPIGKTIDTYAARYDIDPTLLFFLTYVHSFWGEASSGPVPFAESMTGETVRDVVQIHLPPWFIESGLRQSLISTTILQEIAGDAVGFKLRYALHKATLDVSAQPYELNTFSDILLVLQEYPEEFPDLFNPDDPESLKGVLGRSFLAIRDQALVKPYETPYVVQKRRAEYYDSARIELRRFARAAYYATVLDFDLATRVAALLIRYQERHYEQTLGTTTWNALPEYQRLAMLAMTRDVYMPNIGHLGYNLYALPELNATPVEFVASRASRAPDLHPGISTVWRPRDYEVLWAGASKKLRVFSEVYECTKGAPLPGLPAALTVFDAAEAVARAR